MERSTGLLLLVKCFLKWETLKTNQVFVRKQFCDDVEEYLTSNKFTEKLSSKTLATYFGNFDNGDFKRLESSTSVTDALARFANGMTFIEFSKLEINVPEEEISRVLAAMRIDFFFKLNQFSSRKIMQFDVLERLEFGTNDTEINCITPSLKWTFHYVRHYLTSFKNTNNQFRYILTDDLDDKHYHRIMELISNYNVENIKIKRLSDYFVCKNGIDADGKQAVVHKRRRFERIEGITFPIPADIVLYRKILPENRKDFIFGIVDTTVAEAISLTDVALKMETDRGLDLLRWFDHMWELKQVEFEE